MIQETINNAIELALSYNLTKALETLKPVFNSHPTLRDADELVQIEEAFAKMKHYMTVGAADPGRKGLYQDLLRRTYCIAADLGVSWRCKNIGFYITQFQKAAHLNMSDDFIRTVLETFVSDVALLSIDAGGIDADSRREDIYRRHQLFLERLFAAITVACQWSDGERKFWSALAISPTIDINDALVITSAITISAMNQFDINKSRVLANIYINATDNALRQRALVGFVLSLDDAAAALFPDVRIAINDVIAVEGAARELLELQEQIFFCMNAERDTKKIQNEIIPELTKNAPFRVGSGGMIEEREDDHIQDILHPDSADKAMEQIEQSMQKITDMQRQGADIYFGGFSHMKRFPFFAVAANWFMPYFKTHPEVEKISAKFRNSSFIDMILTKSSFCDSDKYSFTFAIASIFDRMPPKLREIIGSSESMGIELSDEEAQSSAYIRRQYLQDLYRFFKLHPQRADLMNPFDAHGRAFFFTSELVAGTEIDKLRPSLAVFLYERQLFNELNAILHTFSQKQTNTLTYWLLRAEYQFQTHNYSSAVESFGKAIEKAPANISALRGRARAAMHCNMFDIADADYAELLKHEPGRKSYLVNRSLALVNELKVDDAMGTISEADYRYPDDISVIRVKAWVLMYQQKPQEALQIYKRIMESKPLPEDFLNMGYALWCLREYGKAADSFRTFVEEKPTTNIFDEFCADSMLLAFYSIDTADMRLMRELVEA